MKCCNAAEPDAFLFFLQNASLNDLIAEDSDNWETVSMSVLCEAGVETWGTPTGHINSGQRLASSEDI